MALHQPKMSIIPQPPRSKARKSAVTGRLSIACVDQTGKFSNLLEDLLKIERFSQYIENQENNNMIEMEDSE